MSAQSNRRAALVVCSLDTSASCGHCRPYSTSAITFVEDPYRFHHAYAGSTTRLRAKSEALLHSTLGDPGTFHRLDSIIDTIRQTIA